jgi:hypothetical protein
MIDVHPPHQATHTWTDFFIHIATIVLGLLIAVGLEQTVEAVHHHREREELIAAMRAEAQTNQPVFERAISRNVENLSYELSLIAALKQATPHNGMVDVALPTYPSSIYQGPARAIWAIAKANGKAALLPDSLAETYNYLDRSAELEYQARDAVSAPGIALTATETRLDISLSHATRLHLSIADSDALVQSLAQFTAASSAEITRMAFWRGANNAIADGVQSREAIEPYSNRSIDAIQQARAKGKAKALALIASENSPRSHAAQEDKP